MKHPTYRHNQPGAFCVVIKFIHSIVFFFLFIFLATVTPRRLLLLEWETLPNNQNKRGKRKSG